MDFDLDVEALNYRWADPDNIDSWSQLVIKHTEDSVDIVTEAPESGIWHLNDDGTMDYARFDYHRRAVESEREAFYLRITGAGDYRYEGADLGILVTRGRLMTKDFKLNRRAKQWISALRARFSARPLGTAEAPPQPVLQPGAFKLL